MIYYKLLLFVRNGFISLKLRLLGCQNVHVLLSSFKNNHLSGDDNGEFVILAEQLIPSLDELHCRQNTTIARRGLKSCGSVRSAGTNSPTQGGFHCVSQQCLPQLTQLFYHKDIFYVTFILQKYVSSVYFKA